MKAIAGLAVVLLLGCSGDDGNTDDAAIHDGVIHDLAAADHAAWDSPQGQDLVVIDANGPSDANLPPDLKAWCVGTTAKLRIGTQDQTNWTDMDAPGSMTGKTMTIEPQFKVGGVKHSFFLTVLYTKIVISPVKVDLSSLKSGESVTKNGSSGPIVPADRRKGIVEIVAAGGGGFKLNVCAWVDGESFYIPGMPMG